MPNGVLIPPEADPSAREHTVVFAGRHEPRKGLQVLLRAWPELHRRTGARLVVAGADPLAVRLLLTRLGVSDQGIDVVGFLSQDGADRPAALDEGAPCAVARWRELRDGADPRVRLRARRSSPPTSRATARSSTPETAVLVPARGRRRARRRRSRALLADEPRRVAMGAARATRAEAHFGWPRHRGRLEEIYERVVGGERAAEARAA